MKSKKIISSFIIIPLCLIVGFIVVQYYLKHNVDYQLKKLENGSLRQKLWAADFLGEKKITAAIPLLMDNVDNIKSSTYINSPKSPESMSCCATFALKNITEKGLGDTCCFDCEEEKKQIILDWQDWYKNDYPQWLKEHQQN